MPDSVDHTAVKGRPGRPPVYSEKERSRRILQAAEQVFTTVGYGAATMEEVARTAGMSKKTIYGLYPDKRCLLAAVVVAADDFPWEDADNALMADPVTELRRRLLALIEFVLSPRQVGLTRLLIAEAEHAPELADDFHERVMAKGQLFLAAAVARLRQDALGPRGMDVDYITGTLFGAAMGDFHLWVLFGKKGGIARQQIESRIEMALRACGFVTSNPAAR